MATFSDLRYLISAVCVGFTPAGCTKKADDAPVAEQASPAPSVRLTPISTPIRVHGELREIMHMGRTERRVDLAPLVGQQGLYGLGALEELGGEVTLSNGQLWLSTPDGHGDAVAGPHPSTTAGATLLVTAVVNR